jgi:hypothetical protein
VSSNRRVNDRRSERADAGSSRLVVTGSFRRLGQLRSGPSAPDASRSGRSGGAARHH